MADRCLKALQSNGLHDDRLNGICNPKGQNLANPTRPPALFAGRRRNGVTPRLHQVRHEGADVVGQIDIFRKPVNDAVGFRQRCAALEHQIVFDSGFKKNLQGPDDPHILFQQMRGPTETICGNTQNIEAISRLEG